MNLKQLPGTQKQTICCYNPQRILLVNKLGSYWSVTGVYAVVSAIGINEVSPEKDIPI